MPRTPTGWLAATSTAIAIIAAACAMWFADNTNLSGGLSTLAVVMIASAFTFGMRTGDYRR